MKDKALIKTSNESDIDLQKEGSDFGDSLALLREPLAQAARAVRGIEMIANLAQAPQEDRKVFDNGQPDRQDQESQPDEPIVLPCSGEVTVEHKEQPSSPAEDKKIHPRRPLPVVPERSPKEE